MAQAPNYIIFADLDGTLLDYHTYDFSDAIPALNLIKEKRIPLILSSSKTCTEILYYQKQLDMTGMPFIAENGAGIFWQNNYFTGFDAAFVKNGLQCLALGTTFRELRKTLETISRKYMYQIHGFHNASIKEIMSRTELKEKAVKRSLKRDFSIPLFYDEKARSILENELPKYGLRIIYGGRFMHVIGEVDKGKAMRLLIEHFENKSGAATLKSIAVGDSLNDFPMLEIADIAILVKRYHGQYESRGKINRQVIQAEIGPAGFNHSIISLLETGGTHE